MIDDHIALLPYDLAKQVTACRNAQSGLHAYQRELASLWAQGRELERDASDKERAETLAKLDDLQATFETTLQRTNQRLTDLEKALTSRKYFQVDLDKICHWLRQADAITFPEINLNKMDNSSELQTELSKFQNVLEQASEYENLLLIVQRIGQEILPNLNEIEHCYLDERLNALPQQYNAILALAKEKRDRVKQIIFEQKDFSTFLSVTHNALDQLQEQFDNLEKQTISSREEELLCLMNEYRNIEKGLLYISPDVRQLCSRNAGFVSWGRQYRAEETQQLVSVHNRLNHINDERIKHLDAALKTLVEHKRLSTKLDSELKTLKEKLAGMKSDTEFDSLENIESLYSLLESVDCVSFQVEECCQQTKSLGLKFDPNAFQETTAQLQSLQSLRCEVKHFVKESEISFTENEDFSQEANKILDWLTTLRDALKEPLSFSEASTEHLHKDMCRLKIVEEEVKSRMRRGDALCCREKERHSSGEETIPAHINGKIEELSHLGAEVQQGINKKKVSYFTPSTFQTWMEITTSGKF